MPNYPRLDDNGLLYYTQQIKQKIDASLPPDMTGATASDNGAHGLVPQPNAGQEGLFLKGNGSWADPLANVPDATQSVHGWMSTTDKTKLDGIETGAEENVIEEVQVNGTALTPSNKSVNITVPTNVSDLTNDSNYQTGSDVDAKIATAVSTTYIPKGSCTFANLPSLVAEHKGWVYNVSDAFTTTSDFVEGSGKTYPVGTNVAVVEVVDGASTIYMYDVLAGFIDTSVFVLGTEMTTISNATIDTIIATAFNPSSGT